MSTNTVVRYEHGGEMLPRTVRAIQAALEAAGAAFLDDDGNGPGVRFRPPTGA